MTNFKCIRCGACCCWPGDVRLKDDEIDRIAAWMGMEAGAFLEGYTRLTYDRSGLSLRDQEDGSCVFFRDGDPPSCFIQEVKPEQCQGFPLQWAHEGWEDDCGAAIEARNSKE